MDDGSNVRSISSTITFCSNVKRRVGILWMANEEKLQKSPDVLCRNWCVVDSRIIFRVRISNSYRLIEENDIGIRSPRVLVEGCIIAFITDRTRAEFEKQPSGRTATRAPIQPQHEGVFRGIRTDLAIRYVYVVQ
jgi:hypothetical protein